MTTGMKLACGGVVVVGVTAYMAYLGAASSWQYYLTVDECIASATDLAEYRIRVSGKVARDSLHIGPDRVQATFSLEGTSQNLPVTYEGTLPDGLAEQIEVVVEGQIEDSGTLRGEVVLTRCASKYTRAPRAASIHSSPTSGSAGGG